MNFRHLSLFRSLALVAGGFLLFALTEFTLFHSGLYYKWINPRSYAGSFSFFLEGEKERPKVTKDILVLGDSRIAIGFSENLSNHLLAETPYRLINGGIPAATLRSLYYFLRELKIEGMHYEAIVLSVAYYDDAYLTAPNGTIDRRFVLPYVRLADLSEFANSFGGIHVLRTWEEGIFQGLEFKDDVQDLLMRPRERLRLIKSCKESCRKERVTSIAPTKSLQGLARNSDGSLILPSQLTPDEKTYTQKVLSSPIRPDEGWIVTSYEYWMRKIVSLYEGTGTKIYVMKIPDFAIPNSAIPSNRNSIFRRLGRDGHLQLLDENLFSKLRQPKYFADAVHLNKEGQEIFTRELVAEFSKILNVHVGKQNAL